MPPIIACTQIAENVLKIKVTGLYLFILAITPYTTN